MYNLYESFEENEERDKEVVESEGISYNEEDEEARIQARVFYRKIRRPLRGLLIGPLRGPNSYRKAAKRPSYRAATRP